MKTKHLLILFITIIFQYCTQTSGNLGDEIEVITDKTVSEEIQVTTQTLTPETFPVQYISNGTLSAVKKADLLFETGEIVEIIEVKNGQRVTKGQTIASLQTFKLKNNYQQNFMLLKKAELDLRDLLVGRGYKLTDSATVPQLLWETLKVKSGYSAAKTQFELSKYNLQAAALKAPFEGIIANLNMKEYNLASTSEIFCTVIDNSRFEVIFHILESELQHIKVATPVKIIPFSYDSLVFSGTITERNPVVNQNGLIQTKALIRNQNQQLVEGMNVKVVVEIPIKNQLIVPKEAVVLRSGKEVVFTYEQGLAKWKYVKTGYENSTSYTIAEGLKPGDEVIVSGNLNLGHDAKISIKN